MKYIYTAHLLPMSDGRVEAQVPDIPHCFTSGEDIPDALAMITDAATLMLTAMEDEGLAIPVPSAPGSLACPPGGISTLLTLDTDVYRQRYDTTPVRKSVSIPAWMDRQARQRGISCSQVLQDSLRALLAS